MRIAIDSDSSGAELKSAICEHVRARGFDIEDLDYLAERKAHYPDIGFSLAQRVQTGDFDRGILICGTGEGMAMCANKVRGVYAGPAHDVYSAERLRKSNDAQIITLGTLVIGVELAKTIIDAWLDSEFQAGRSAPKVNRMRELERQYLK